MPSAIFDGLALVDATGHVILTATLASLVLAVGANLSVRARYVSLEKDLKGSGKPLGRFSHSLLNDIVRDVQEAIVRSVEVNTQAIVEDRFQSQLKPLLLAERFVKGSTGLVIILGLLGTFYGLTLSIGRLVHLVSGDPVAMADVSQAMASGLSQALMGMAVAFSNSLLGIASAVVLTVLGIFSNVSDRRTALMIQVETYLERVLPIRGLGHAGNGLDRSVVGFGDSVSRLEGCVSRFESALRAFGDDTRGLREFNVKIVACTTRTER